MKKPYITPESTVVAIEPVKMISQSPGPPVDLHQDGQDALGRETVRYTTVPSDDLWEE